MIRGSISKGRLHREGGFTFPREYYFDPVFHLERDLEIEAFLARRFPEIPLYNMESNLVQPEHLPPAPLHVGGIQPNLIVGALLGAEFVFPEGTDSDITEKPLSGFSSTAALPEPEELLSHPLIREFDAQIDRFRTAASAKQIIPPFFWDRSGRATIHGFITTSFKFAGENIFVQAFEDPELVAELHRWISDAYSTLIRHFASKAELPVTGIHIGECTGAMISASRFEQLVLPYADAAGKAFGAVRFHSCGQSDHLVEAMSKITNLRSIDTGSYTSVKKIREVLGPEFFIETAPPAQLLMENSPPDKVRAWLRATAEENGGGPLHIGYHFEPGYSEENMAALHNEGIQLGIAEPGRPPLYG